MHLFFLILFNIVLKMLNYFDIFKYYSKRNYLLNFNNIDLNITIEQLFNGFTSKELKLLIKKNDPNCKQLTKREFYYLCIFLYEKKLEVIGYDLYKNLYLLTNKNSIYSLEENKNLYYGLMCVSWEVSIIEVFFYEVFRLLKEQNLNYDNIENNLFNERVDFGIYSQIKYIVNFTDKNFDHISLKNKEILNFILIYFNLLLNKLEVSLLLEQGDSKYFVFSNERIVILDCIKWFNILLLQTDTFISDVILLLKCSLSLSIQAQFDKNDEESYFFK